MPFIYLLLITPRLMPHERMMLPPLIVDILPHSRFDILRFITRDAAAPPPLY